MAYNITKLSTASTIKKLIYFGVIIACILIINGLSRSIYDLWQKQDLLVKAREDLELEKQANIELKTKLTYVNSEQFIEEEARNKLFMVKEGESSVIVPKILGEKKEVVKAPELPNWQKWLNLFVSSK
jgi:cell division protein FtsB